MPQTDEIGSQGTKKFLDITVGVACNPSILLDFMATQHTCSIKMSWWEEVIRLKKKVSKKTL